MKYSLECRVEATMNIVANVVMRWDDFEVFFLPEAGGLFNGIRITTRLLAGYSLPTFTAIDGHLEIHMNADRALHDEIVKRFQYLESSLAFCCPVQRVRWHSTTASYLPENEEERAAIRLNSMNLSHYSDNPPKIMDFPEASFLSAIQAANDCPDLVVPLSFWC